MAMTPTQLQILRMRFGDNDQVVFPNDGDLNLIWDLTNAASSEEQHYEAALAMMFETLLNSSVKLHDYTAGATGEKLSQVVRNIEGRLKAYKPALDAALNTQPSVATAAMRLKPRQGRERP